MTPGSPPRRVLICEDSTAYATALSRFLEWDGEIEVVGIAASGEQAIADVKRLRPQLLTLDMQLPGISGLEVVEALMSDAPLPIVILSAHVDKGSERAAQALAAGALEALPKDKLRLDQPDDMWAQAMRSRLRRLSSMRLGAAVKPASETAESKVEVRTRVARAVAIGASTGGPPALETILGSLPPEFPIPVLVVQHMAAGFIDGFAAWLDKKVAIPVAVAVDGDEAGPGVWFAPDGAHLLLDGSLRFELDSVTPGPHRPSADPLLRSLAAACGGEGVGVVLTGMGRDGAEGAAALHAAGGLVIAQNEASSVVYGMPKAAAEAGADLLLPPHGIGRALRALRLPGGDR